MKVVCIARVGLMLGMIVLLAAFAVPAMAATTIPIKMTFVENISKQSDCTNPLGLCGTGQVVPLGQATETIEFGAGCGGTCDRRTIVLENGTLIIDETFSPNCLRGCNPHVFTGVLTDVIVGGTSAYAGASGTLSGTVRATVGVAIHIKLSGTLIIP
jgi:hypothetical protein